MKLTFFMFLKIKGTFSFVYAAHFFNNVNEKIALKYIIPTSSPSRTKQEIDCLLNIGYFNLNRKKKTIKF